MSDPLGVLKRPGLRQLNALWVATSRECEQDKCSAHKISTNNTLGLFGSWTILAMDASWANASGVSPRARIGVLGDQASA